MIDLSPDVEEDPLTKEITKLEELLAAKRAALPLTSD